MKCALAVCVCLAIAMQACAEHTVSGKDVEVKKRGLDAQTVVFVIRCPTGYYQPSSFNTNCVKCPCGTIAIPTSGSPPWGAWAPHSCTTCPANTYAPTAASASCLPCDGNPAGSCSCLTSAAGAVANKCQYIPQGTRVTVRVQGNTNGNKLFGNDPYAEDSDLGAAIVHAGLAGNGEIKEVTLQCVGEVAEFTGTTAFGVTSQGYPTPYGAFSFKNLPPPLQAPYRCGQEPCMLNKCVVTGQSVEVLVTGGTGGTVYGSGPFTDDSSLSAAAVHAGVISVGEEKILKVQCAGPQTSYSGSTSNGVTSVGWTAWQFSYTLVTGPSTPAPTTSSCNGACLENACPEGDIIDLRVKGTTFGWAWGTDSYSDDSTVASAAVHAGLVADGATAFVRATCAGAATSFTGSSRNGFITESYGLPWPRSFTLEAIPEDLQAVACPAAHQCLHKICKVSGQYYKVSVTGSAVAKIWGDGIYSDDSPVAEAAVHMGLVSVGATTTLTAICKGPQSSFGSSTAHGVTSTSYGPWGFSYTLE